MPTKRLTLKTTLTLCSFGLLAVGCSGNVPIPGARNLTATFQAAGIQLQWEPVGLPATDLELERREPGGRFQKISTFTTETYEFMDTTPDVQGCTYRVLSFADNQPLLGTYSTQLSPTAAKVAN